MVDFLEDEIERLSLQESVHVYPGGCQNHCESGPTMVVYPGPTFYQEVDRGRLQRIAREHFAGGRPVAEFFWVNPAGSGRAVKKPLVGQDVKLPSLPNPPRQGKPPKPKKVYDVDDFKW